MGLTTQEEDELARKAAAELTYSQRLVMQQHSLVSSVLGLVAAYVPSANIGNDATLALANKPMKHSVRLSLRFAPPCPGKTTPPCPIPPYPIQLHRISPHQDGFTPVMRHKFGFDKVAVAATAVGRLLGLRCGGELRRLPRCHRFSCQNFKTRYFG